jgi:uncharacterized protein YuzB (UPF0349 family)
MIKICNNNKYYNEVFEYLSNKGIDVNSKECLGRCDLCHSGAFVQHDEEFITAENAKLLILKLEALNIL